MLECAELIGLIAGAAEEPDSEKALDRLTQAILELTESRNAMIARMNDELGTVELRHGAGRDWTIKAFSEQIRVGDWAGEGIVASVAATGNSFVSGCVQEDPRYRNLFNSASEIAVAIKDSRGRVRGVLNVESDAPDKYTQRHLLLCEAAAATAGMLIERDDTLRREQALLLISGALNKVATEDELIQRVFRVTSKVLRFQSISLFLLDPEKGVYVLRSSSGLLENAVGSVAYEPGEGCTGWVCQNGRLLQLDNPQEDPRWRGMHLDIEADRVASYLAVPIIQRGRCIGALRALRRQSDNPYQDVRFTDGDRRLLTAIAQQLAAGLENVRTLQRVMRSERMAAWGELSAKSAHMIGNRAFALRGDMNELGHLLSEKPVDVGALRSIHASLMTNLSHLEEILQDFRDFVTATELSKASADLNLLVREAVEEVFPRRSAVNLEFRLSKHPIEAEVDARRLRRAIAELIENVLNHIEDGRLEVKTGVASPALVEKAKLPVDRRYAMIQISDDGPGIANEDKKIIFRPFYSGRVKGMGLGLSIVKGILDAHGGTAIEVGKPGKGAVFVLFLPLRRLKEKQTG